jgi:addiction module RelE/StbE family toxin
MTPRKYSVGFAESAVRDLEEIARFVAAESPASARKLVERLRERSHRLGTLPERGRVVPELAAFGIHAFREIVVEPYRIIYRVRGREVLVLAVFDGRRDLEDILLDRLVRTGLS